jgi:MATE family multidrug resistance protein
MNAALLGGYLPSILTLILMSIAGTTEVFVGQYNGAAREDGVAPPVVQMVYFSLISALFVCPIGYLANHLRLFPRCYAEEGMRYQSILLYFCWMPALTAAFTGFFVGRGRTKIITAIVVVGTLVNVALDMLLIFGHGTLIPPMGCAGAAIATVVAEAVQVIILAAGFWSGRNRKIYRTAASFKFDGDLFRRCFRIGLPLSMGRCVEMLAWQVVCIAMGFTSKTLMTVHGFAITVYVFFAFICDGLVKGTAVITANFIGQRDPAAAKRSLRKLVAMALLLCSTIVFPAFLCPNLIFRLLNRLHEDISDLYPAMATVFRVLTLNVALESVWCVLWGILLGGGDTKYPVIVNLCSVWTIVVLPTLVLFFFGKLQSVLVVQLLWVCYNLVFMALIYRRYRSLKWFRISNNENRFRCSKYRRENVWVVQIKLILLYS